MAMTFVSMGVMETAGQEQSDGYHETTKYQIAFVGTYTPADMLAITTFTNGMSTYNVPTINSEHAVMTGSIVTNRNPSLDSDSDAVGTTTYAGTAYLEVVYSPKPAGGWQLNPIGQAEVRGGGSEETVVLRVDQDGKPFLNSAKDLYADVPGQPLPGAKFEITYNYSSNPTSIMATYSNTVNSDSWFGNAAGMVRIGTINWTKQQINGAYCYPTTFPICIRSDGHRWKPIDNGYRKNVSGLTKPQHHCDETGNPTMVPILLDGTGHELAAGATPVVYPTNGFKILKEQSFSSLPLPNPATY